ENPNSIFDRFFKNKNSLYYQAYTFILAPLWEEWLFRGVIPLVLSAFGVTLQTGLLISGILFIAAHYNKDFTLRQWLTLAAAALIYSLAVFPMFEIPVLGFLIYSFYSVTGYTPLPVLAHILYNLLTAGHKQFPITSIIERDYPLLKGKSAVTVLASNSTKPFSEVLEQARAKAALGTDVHILIPKTISSNLDGAAIKETQNSGLQHILSEVETQENGAKIHVHTYYEDNAQTADFAFDAFNWLLAEIGADNISMLEIDSKEQDIPKTLRARWEQANAKAATYYADGVSFQNRLEQSLEKQKTNRNGRNMKNGKILSTTFLVSGLSNGIFKSKEFTPFDSFVIETSVQEITKNKKKIRDFVKVGRENGKEVILRIKAQNKEDAKAALNFDFKQFRSKIKKNDIGEIGISGAILDFSNLENADILDLSIRAKTFYLNVKAENSDAVVALESKEHPQSYSQAGIENFSHTAAAEIGKDEYIEVNEQRIIDELDKAMDTDSRMVIIRGDVVRSLKNVGVFVDCLAFLSGNVKRWINKSALTSQGSFRKGKKDGLIRGKDKIKENDETPYNLLRKMRETYELKEREILLNKIDEIFAASYLERFKKSADAKECELIFSEAQGFLQGALESIESQNQYLKDRVFAISTDEDIIRGAFVEAKLNAVKSKEEIENLKEKSYIEPPQCLIKSQERENSLRETFNLLSDYIDNGYKDDKNAAQNKRIAISKLISMLPVLYKTEIKIESLSIKTDAMLDGVQAMLRAA
ncbi:MAG: CPBP family intramembrane metalloprotease, partial [Endomicrobium sp.]|nr:CPBP family intramembrane metalloprotease [Endomicrobium sp.]